MHKEDFLGAEGYGYRPKYRIKRGYGWRAVVLALSALTCFAVVVFAGASLISFLRARNNGAIDDKAQNDVVQAFGHIGSVDESKKDPQTLAGSVQLDDWPLTLVNKDNPLPEGYVPALREVGNRGYRFDVRAADALDEMLLAMQQAQLSPLICSAYRSIEKQEQLYGAKLGYYLDSGYDIEDAKREAATVVAYPGTSEHHLGLAVDIVSIDNQNLDETQMTSPETQWLHAYCAQYGFVIRYPEGKSDITNVIFEPWHYRYVGKEAALGMTQAGQCLEEYLQAQ